MANIENIDDFFKLLKDNKDMLVFGPAFISEKMKIHFSTAKNLIENISTLTKYVYRLQDEGYKLSFGKSPKGIPRFMIIPSEEKLKEIEEKEVELGFDSEFFKPYKEVRPKGELSLVKISKEISQRIFNTYGERQIEMETAPSILNPWTVIEEQSEKYERRKTQSPMYFPRKRARSTFHPIDQLMNRQRHQLKDVKREIYIGRME